MKFLIAFLISISLAQFINCQTNPVIIKWTKSTGLGYKNYKTNVFRILYSTSYSWVSTNSIPSYTIGPWASNPNDATGKDYTFKFPLQPSYNNGAKTATPLGHIGIWINGVSIYNPDDGMSYNNLGIWKRNAYVWEGVSFDKCNGHPDVSSEYHSHISSNCSFTISSTSHSPLIGFAFDGFPIYGPYGYSKANDTASGVKRILTSYRLRTITNRTTLANGTVLSSSQYGPSIASAKLSSYLQDYEYVKSLGDLDEFNGRYCKTPEYPTGTYAYFATIDANSSPAYPYGVGPYYRGSLISGNTGQGSGKQIPTAPFSTYYQY